MAARDNNGGSAAGDDGAGTGTVPGHLAQAEAAATFERLVPVGAAFWPPSVVAALRAQGGAALDEVGDATVRRWIRDRDDVLGVGWGVAMRLNPAACPDGLAAHPAARLLRSRLHWECDAVDGRTDVEEVVREHHLSAGLSASAEARLQDAVLRASRGFRAALWVRLAAGVYGRQTLPVDLDEGTLLAFARQRVPAGASFCLHSGPLRSIYVDPDGSTRVTDTPPNMKAAAVDDELLLRCLRRGILPGVLGWSERATH